MTENPFTMLETNLQTLNHEWGVSIARNVHTDHGTWPAIIVHSPGMAYAFDSANTGLDSPAAAMDMLTAHGLHELHDPHTAAPEAYGWHMELDRPDSDDYPRMSRLVGPYPLAPIGPLARGPIPGYWRDLVTQNAGWCHLMFVSGLDLVTMFDDERGPAFVQAARQHRVAGGSVRVLP